MQQQLKVPIGLIEVAVGGSTTESWIGRYTMEHHPVLVNELKSVHLTNISSDGEVEITESEEILVH